MQPPDLRDQVPVMQITKQIQRWDNLLKVQLVSSWPYSHSSLLHHKCWFPQSMRVKHPFQQTPALQKWKKWQCLKLQHQIACKGGGTHQPLFFLEKRSNWEIFACRLSGHSWQNLGWEPSGDRLHDMLKIEPAVKPESDAPFQAPPLEKVHYLRSSQHFLQSTPMAHTWSPVPLWPSVWARQARVFPGCLRRWQPVHIAGRSSNRSLPSAGLGQTLRGGLKRGTATPEASSFCEALQHPARVLRIPFPGGRRGCWDPSASTLGAAGGAGTAVPVSSVMCLRTSSSGTNFTCRERLLRVSSGRLMAAPVTWARSRRRGALPPGGADRRRLTPHLTPHGAAPAGPGSRPLPAPPAEAAAARGGTGLTCQPVAVPRPTPRQPTRAPCLEWPVLRPTRAPLPARLGRRAGLPPRARAQRGARARGRCGDAKPARAPCRKSAAPPAPPHTTALTARPTRTGANHTSENQQFTKWCSFLFRNSTIFI